MKARVLLLAVLCFLTLSARAAAVDYFLQIEGVEGESADQEFPRSIEIESWSWGVSNQAVAGGGGTGRATFQDFQITKRLDKSSPKLMLACASGKHYPTVIITMRKAGDPPQKYYKITMQDCIVSSFQTSGQNSDSRPAESLSLNYTKISFEYTPYDATGRPLDPVIFGWDLVNNVEL